MSAVERSLRLVRQAPTAVMPNHWHERARLCFVLAGEFDETIGRRRSNNRQGALLFRPVGLEHEEVFGPQGAAYGVLDVGDLFREAADRWGFDLDAAAAVTPPGAYRLNSMVRREAASWDEHSPLVCETLTLEVLATLVRAQRGPGRHGGCDRLAAKALDYVRANLDRAFGLAELARAVGAHPTHVARSFRRAYGESVGALARRLRVERAAELLATTDASLAAIAVDCGFSSQAHLTTVFGAVMGHPPGAFRRRLR